MGDCARRIRLTGKIPYADKRIREWCFGSFDGVTMGTVAVFCQMFGSMISIIWSLMELLKELSKWIQQAGQSLGNPFRDRLEGFYGTGPL